MAEALRPVFIAKNLLIKPSMKPSQLGPYSHCIQMAVGENSQNYQQLEMDGFKSKWPFFCESKQVPKPTNGHCLDLDEPEKIHQR